MPAQNEGATAQKLRALYAEDQDAKIFFDFLAKRKRVPRVLGVNVILDHLNKLNTFIKRSNLIRLLKIFDELGVGEFIVGRRGVPTRIRWLADPISLARFVREEDEQINWLTGTAEVDQIDEEEGLMVEHSFWIRPDLLVTLELPVDLSSKEAERLAAFIKSLPYADE